MMSSIRRGGESRAYYITQASKGEQVVPNLPLPFWGEVTVRETANVTEVRAGGSRRPVELEEGMFGVEISVSFPKIQGSADALAFYNLVVASGSPEALTWFTLGVGDDRGCFAIQDCKMNSRSFSGAAGEAEWFTGDCTIFGGLVRDISTLDKQTYIDTPGFAMHEAVHSAFEISRFSSSFENGLEMIPVVAGPATSRVSREWDYMPEGSLSHSGEYGVFVRPTQNMNADFIVSTAHNLLFTNKADPYNQIRLSWTGQKAQDREARFPGADENIEYTVPWLATDETLEVV